MKASQDRMNRLLEEMLRQNSGRRVDVSPATNARNEVNSSSHTRLTTPRMDFPKFTHDNPRSWLRKCNKYFMINPMSEVDKVVMVGMYFEGAVENWYLDNVEGRESMGWNRFIEMLMYRFVSANGEN